VIRSKNPIARLPYGVNVHKENQGWRVRLGKRFTGGAAVRKRFDKLADARAWICSQEGQKSHIQATALTPSQLAEAKDAFTKLNGASLAEAVRYYLAHAKPAGGTKKIEEAIDAVLKSKADAGRSRLHVRHLGWSLKKFGAAFPKHNVNEIHRHHLEDWLNAQSYGAKTRLNYLRDFNILFNFAVSRGWTAGNPAADIEKPSLPDSDIAVLKTDQVSALLASSPGTILAGVATKVFAGLRTAELWSLDWSEVSESEIIVKGVKAKTRQRRVVNISDNLRAWLLPYRKASGPITSLTGKHWHFALGAAAEIANAPMPMNILRHTFGSYHYALHRNENLTAAEMGNSPAMVFRHYRAVVTPEAAKQFWNLLP
jgi:integrase